MYFSELSGNDMDYMSFCDNSLYVLPPKTELNSSFYSQDIDNSFNPNGNMQKDDFSQRKISNNVEIPTYKGFSIANGYSVKKGNHVSFSKNIPRGASNNKKNIQRKVHVSLSSTNDEFSLTKKLHKIPKNKSKIKNEEKMILKENRAPEKPNKRLDTFLGTTNHYHTASTHKTLKKVGIEKDQVQDQPKSLNDCKEIKKYMDDKRSKLKIAMDKNKLLEKERKEKIARQLKQLSEKIKLQEKEQPVVNKNVKSPRIDNNDERMKPILKKSEMNHQNGEVLKQKSFLNNRRKSPDICEMSVDDEFSIESEILGKSIKSKLAQWAPMETEELEMMKVANESYMRSAISKNKHADNILSDILKMSDKIQSTKRELFQTFNHNRQKPNINKLQSQESTSSESSSFSNELETTEDYQTSDFKKKSVPSQLQKKKLKTELTPFILANRARRKLHDDSEDINEENDTSESAYDDCIARLTKESENRSKQLQERRRIINLPLHKPISKSIDENKQHISKKHDLVETIETDTLTFMRTYRRCQVGSNISNLRHSKSNATNSRISNNESINIVSSSHKSHFKSNNGQKGNSISEKRSNFTGHSMDELQQTEESGSDIEKMVSFRLSNKSADSRISSDYSEVEVTVENSTVNHFSFQKSTKHKVFSKTEYSQYDEARLSPNSLERQLLYELHYHDSLQASMEQLLQLDRFQGVGFAQQETVSLAQILKTRQWKDSMDDKTNLCLDKFTTALENLNKAYSSQLLRRHPEISSTTTFSQETTSDTSSKTVESFSPMLKKGKLTTESDASEIQEEIVDFIESPEPTHVSRKIDNRSVITAQKPSVKVKGKSVVQPKEKSKSTIDSVHELQLNHSNIDQSIQEIISENNSGSKSAMSDRTVQSSPLQSIAESLDSQSLTKSLSDEDGETEIPKNKIKNDDSSSLIKSVKTDSDVTKSERSATEMSTKSFEQRKKSASSSYSSKQSVISKSDSKSTTDQRRSNENGSDINFTNYSKDAFESNSDYQISTSESEVLNRVNVLRMKKEKKQNLVDKLKHKLNVVKQRQKEKTLRNYITHLDSQIENLKDELKNPNFSSPSFSLSTSTVISKKDKKQRKTTKDILPTRNRESASSSSSSMISSKDDELKSISIRTESSKSSSTTLVISDLTKDKIANENINIDQLDTTKMETAGTPRGSKQIQFEDINEEYSATSNQDSSELKTPSSEKYRFSSNVTKSDNNFPVLVLDKSNEKNDDIDQDSIDNNENDDMKIISARTIHSEISEIPLESEAGVGDLSSDQEEIDNVFDKVFDESEKPEHISSSLSNQDFYSEDFSDVMSATTKHSSKSMNIITVSREDVINENQEEKFSYEETSSETDFEKSNGGPPPKIPLRRKFLMQSDEDESLLSVKENMKRQAALTIENLCSYLYESIFNQIMTEDVLTYNRPVFVPRLIGLDNDDDDGDGDVQQQINKQVFPSIMDEMMHDFSIDQPLNDAKFVSFASLVSWNDDCIIPLVDIATEYLFNARQNRKIRVRPGIITTNDAFEFCRHNMPAEFLEVNKDEEVVRIYQQWMAQRLRDKDQMESSKLFISRIAIYNAVLEIMINIYELDDFPEPSPWMAFSYDSIRTKKLVLWQGIKEPDSLDLVRRIVKKQLELINVIGTNSQQKSMKRSRQHQWFIKQTDDVVDKLLIDETFQDDINWLNYDEAIEKTVFLISDEIFESEISELSNTLLKL